VTAGACLGANKAGVYVTGGTAAGTLTVTPLNGGAATVLQQTVASTALAASDADVYFGNSDATGTPWIGSVALGKKTFVSEGTTAGAQIIAVAASSTELVLLTSGSIMKFCDLATQCPANSGARANSTATDITALPSSYAASSPSTHTIIVGPFVAGPIPPPFTDPNASPTGIVSDGVGTLYWARLATGEVVTSPAAAMKPVVLASNQSGLKHLAVDPARKVLFWTTSPPNAGGAVTRLDLATTAAAPKVVATGVQDANCVAVYGGAVFWTSGGHVFKAPE
jgi:hypothetical protein